MKNRSEKPRAKARNKKAKAISKKKTEKQKLNI
jgi:hypothetical protein